MNGYTVYTKNIANELQKFINKELQISVRIKDAYKINTTKSKRAIELIHDKIKRLL